jgi:hypothetical protein
MVGELVAAGCPPAVAARVVAEAFIAGAASADFRSSNAKRQQRYRDRHRNETVTNRNEVTPDSDTTNQEQTVTNRNEVTPDSDTTNQEQTVTNRNEVTLCYDASLSKNINKKERERRGTRIPPEFPTADDLEFAASQGWSDKQIGDEAANFRDYWLGVPGAKGVKLDWPATWRKWVRSSRVKPVASLTTTIASTSTNWRPILESYLRFKHWPKGHGNEPGMPSCRAPPELLREFGFLKETG